jgi:hypothetical protein
LVLATSQKSPVPQLVLSVQVAKQALAPQMNGVQSVVPGLLLQLPLPSQALGFCCVLPMQLSAIEPQAVPAIGKVQAAVVSSQSVAPQGAVTRVQAVVQQWPVPLIPHTLETQAAFSVQAPVAIWGSQAPVAVLQ